METRIVKFPRRGEIYRFIQIYDKELPKIITFGRNQKKTIELDCLEFFSEEFLKNLPKGKIGHNYSLQGGGNITYFSKDNKREYHVWNVERQEGDCCSFNIDEEHLKDYIVVKNRKIRRE